MAKHRATDEKVFHHFRISITSDRQKDEENDLTEKETHVVYNGISANSWLMPIGVTARRKSAGAEASGIKLHKECHQSLIERARSASLMFGKREIGSKHNEIPVSVQGIKLGAGFVASNGFQGMNRHRDTSFMRFSDRAVPLYLKNERRRIQKEWFELQRRPKTAPYAFTQNRETREASVLCDNLSVVKLAHKTTDSEPATPTKPVNRAKTDPGEEFVNIFLDENNVGAFTSIRQMSAAYRAYLEKSPMASENLHVNTPNSSRINSAASRTSRARSARSSNANQESQHSMVPRNRFQDSESYPERPRSSWRPLMTHEDDDDHSNCTHRCKQCFNACLVSEDYMSQLEEKKHQRDSKNRERYTNKRGNNKKKDSNNNGSSSPGKRVGFGVYSNRRLAKAEVKEHPEVVADYNFGLSIHNSRYPEHNDMEQDENEMKNQLGSLLATVNLSERVEPTTVLLKHSKKGLVKTLGNISKAISSNEKPVGQSGHLEVQGASVTDTPEEPNDENLKRKQTPFNMAQYRTFHRVGLLSPIPSKITLSVPEELRVMGNLKPQHSRTEDSENNSPKDKIPTINEEG